MKGAADVAETEYTPFRSKPDTVPVRHIVRQHPSQYVGTNALPALHFAFHTSSDHPYRIPSVDSG